MLDYSFDKILVSNNELKENLCYTNSLFSMIDYKFSKYIEENDYQFKDMGFYDLKIFFQ
jgi:hypothetical protein